MTHRGVLLRLLVIVLLPILAAGPVAAPAQAQAGGVFLYPHWVDSTQFPQVTLFLSAWNATGVPLINLLPEQFTLAEDGGTPFHPAAVQMDTDAPVQVALAIDVSASMSGRPLQDAQQAAARFLDRLAPHDQVALVAFSNQVDPQPAAENTPREIAFTPTKTTVYDAVEGLQAGGSTELYLAAAKAARLFSGEPDGHRAVLLLSDGRNEPADLGDPQEAIGLAQARRTPFFVVGLGSQIDGPYLKRLASETGGLFLAAPSSAELGRVFGEMATLLKTQYRLTYSSTLPQDGRTHALALQLRVEGGEAGAQVQFGPLPLQPATPTAAPTNTPSATASPAVAATSASTTSGQESNSAARPVAATPVNRPGDDAASELPSNLLWGAGAAGVVLAAAAAWWVNRRRSHAPPERCLKCGYDMTGRSGACPQCGETKRAPTPKGLG